MVPIGLFRGKGDSMKTDYSDEIVWEVAPPEVAPIPEQLEVWDVIFGGGEIFPQRGMAPPHTYAEWEKFADAAAQR